MSDAPGAPRLFLCDCLGSQSVDPTTAARACGAAAAPVSTHLCRGESDRVSRALEAGERVVVACGQEAATFHALAEELGGVDRLACIDIRDRAGWSDEGARAGPKQAALLAESRVTAPPTPAMEMRSEGVLLIVGPGDAALEAAAQVGDRLAATVVATDPPAMVPAAARDAQVALGRVASAQGRLGAFGVRIDSFAELEPAGRGEPRFAAPRDGALSECDLILDLTGGLPFFPAPETRDGYERADPADRAGVAEALLRLTGFVGEFEKPIYVELDKALCAHKRSGQPGCDRCLTVCPTGAIVPDGETVRIDPGVCAGCGACAAVCPSGAAAYAFPERGTLWRRLEALTRGWREAGGGAFRLLIHDAPGLELIEASARFGRGLPADVLPFALNEATRADHALALAALACGASEVVALLHPRKAAHADALRGQIALTDALSAGVGAGGRARLVETDDPDALEAALWVEPAAPLGAGPITPIGDARAVTRQALGALAAAATRPDAPFALPADIHPGGAPYGAVLVDDAACTLCLACVSLCPSGALLDNPDRPQLRFLEDACLQCGICAAGCPETAIRLEPRYDLDESARRPRVLREEEPFECVSCGKPFGVKSVVARISEKLVGSHWMFADDARARLIQMCDDCRVQAQFHSENNPFQIGAPRRPRTTDDDLAERAAKGPPPKLRG